MNIYVKINFKLGKLYKCIDLTQNAHSRKIEGVLNFYNIYITEGISKKQYEI